MPPPLIFGGQGSGSLSYGSGGGNVIGVAQGGVNLEAIERSGRRMSLLATYAPDLVYSSPEGALNMVEQGSTDDDMLRSAISAQDYASVQRIGESLVGESDEAAAAMYAGLPKPIADALKAQGYQPPEVHRDSGGGRFGINLPDFLPGPDELTVSDDFPILGPVLGTAQHAIGEGLEGARDVTTKVLTPFAWASEQTARYWRMNEVLRDQGLVSVLGGGIQSAQLAYSALRGDDVGFASPGQIADAWRDAAPDKGYVRERYRNRAMDLLGGDQQLYDMAHGFATKKTPEDIIKDAGLDPQSPEAVSYGLKIIEAQGMPEFKDAVHALSVGQTSFGRVMTQDIFRQDNTDGGFGRILSGSLDGGFDIVTDPTLAAGTATKGYRFGRYAFMLETQGDLSRMRRTTQLAANMAAERAGRVAPHVIGDITSSEMRRGRAVLNWADHVATRFGENDLARLGRELPDTMTAMDSMHSQHLLRTKEGMLGLDTTDGVLDYLQNREGLMSIAGTRLGGSSTLQRGLRMPSLTETQKKILQAKGIWQEAIDWSRMQYAPKMSQITGAVQDSSLSRVTGQWLASQTAGHAGRLTAALTSHTPYEGFLPLFGDKAVQEFSRMANMGLFTGMDRPTMDAYLNSFIKGDFVTRSNIQEQFLKEIFETSGIQDTSWAQRFLGRHQQAYASDASGDLVDLGGLQTHSATLVDGHHADMVAIPKMREFMKETRRVNTLRYMFNNVPASQVDAALGRWWKPMVLMRLGFIPRAAGEELLAFTLKHGPGAYLGAKGAEWAIREGDRPRLIAQLNEAEAVGNEALTNRLRHQLAERDAFVSAPLRQLTGATDRLFMRLFDSNNVEMSPWRQKFHEKARLLDEEDVVSGLERFADDVTLKATGVMRNVARKTGVNKADVGQWMANKWNPHAGLAARVMLDDPRVARAYTEQIAGSTYTPWEFIRKTDVNGAPIPKIRISEATTGAPAVRELEMRPSGKYDIWNIEKGDDLDNYYRSLYANQNRVKGDRVGSTVLENVLPRWTGEWGQELADYIGFDDAGQLRGFLNDMWSHAGADDAEIGRKMQSAARKLADDPDAGEGLRVWLGKEIDKASAELGLPTGKGRAISEYLHTTQELSPKHWMLYDKVDPERLIDSRDLLERQGQYRATARLAKPDMARKLREMRLYASDDRLAVPVADGFQKLYVPMFADGAVAPRLAANAELEESIAQRIMYIGGYSEEQARMVAGNFVSQAPDQYTAGVSAAAKWGAADPRITDAVMDAVEQVYGTRMVHGILEVPDEAMDFAFDQARSAGVRTTTRFDDLGQEVPNSARFGVDFTLDDWRLTHVQPTDQTRRMVKLEVGDDWYDEASLSEAWEHWRNPQQEGVTRVYSADGEDWATDVPGDGSFYFTDMDTEDWAAYQAHPGRGSVMDEYIVSKMPHWVDPTLEKPTWYITDRQMSEGLGEIEALEKVSNATLGEVYDLFTTFKRRGVDDDVLHEIVEPMMRPDKVIVDEVTQHPTIEYSYGFDHLIANSDARRLPQETYGPELIAARDLKWDKVVQNWFEGPVDHAISSIIRKPMFVTNFGQQLANQRHLVDLFVDPELMAKAKAMGLAGEEADRLALGISKYIDGTIPVPDVDDAIRTKYTEFTGTERGVMELSDAELKVMKDWSRQRGNGLRNVRGNAMQRAVDLTTPFIDDHRVRSAFQNYVGNFIPFQFAEEQFLKRWVRNVVESPEIIRKMQLSMNGLRAMGVVRKDERGNEIFVYPLMGEAVTAISGVAATLFGENLRVPYVGAMTGQVGYTLPGLGSRFGVPSVGPLVAMPLEVLSRHFPEIADIEAQVSGPGADRPVWSYFVPSWAGRAWESVMGTYDKGALASATMQAMQTLTANGMAPPENATPEQQEEFKERAIGIARTIMMSRALLGMATPAAPEFRTNADDLNQEWVTLLRTAPDADAATQAFIAKHPDMQPGDLMAATVFTSESNYAGLDTPTDETFGWIKGNEELVRAFPAAAPWLLPRAGADDPFSYKAWAQQVAIGLRTRKHPDDFVNDMRFAAASQDYFNTKMDFDARMETAVGPERTQMSEQWNQWKATYFRQHPVFAAMLEDPTRQQRREQSMRELEILSADPEGPVPQPLAELVDRFRRYQYTIAGLRGQRTQSSTFQRKEATTEFANEAQWRVTRDPWLADFYLRIIQPEIRGLDDDAVRQTTAA